MLTNKKVKGYALSIIQDPVEPNLVFVGTEQGLWVSLDNGKKFQQFKNGYPSVSTYDFAIQEREADLVIATFGRALWILDDIRPLRALAHVQGIMPSKKLIAFEPPLGYEVNMKNPAGIEYSIWGTYEGENKKQGAEISFFLDKTKTDTGKFKVPDSAHVYIYNASNARIRSLKIKTDTGFNRIYWGMEEKGIRNFGSRNGRRSANTEEEPGGLLADPGTYKIVIESGKEKDSLMLNVNDDPRTPLTKEMRNARRAFNSRIDEISGKVLELNDRLNEAEEIIGKVNENLKNMDSSRADSIKKSGKVLLDSIKSIRYLVTGKPQELQGYGTVPQTTVSSVVGAVKRNVVNKNVIPGPQEERLFKKHRIS